MRQTNAAPKRMEGALAKMGNPPNTDSERVRHYDIEWDALPLDSHWQHMRKAGDHLAEILDDMAAMVRLSRGEASPADLERLDIESMPNGEWFDYALDAFDAWALEVRMARWSQAGDIARVVAVLGTGGPHVELDISHTAHGEPERVELRRYWTQTDKASSTDTRALDVLAEFVAAFLGGDA